VDLIITNPPLGSRVKLDAAKLLVEALPNLARQLAPEGRLVWITPATKKTTPVAEKAGLHLAQSYAIDLGGVRGQLERWDRRSVR
jgi:tRNA G10  N-methylase Trm11